MSVHPVTNVTQVYHVGFVQPGGIVSAPCSNSLDKKGWGPFEMLDVRHTLSRVVNFDFRIPV